MAKRCSATCAASARCAPVLPPTAALRRAAIPRQRRRRRQFRAQLGLGHAGTMRPEPAASVRRRDIGKEDAAILAREDAAGGSAPRREETRSAGADERNKREESGTNQGGTMRVRHKTTRRVTDRYCLSWLHRTILSCILPHSKPARSNSRLATVAVPARSWNRVSNACLVSRLKSRGFRVCI